MMTHQTAVTSPAPRFRSSMQSPLPGVELAAWRQLRDALDMQPMGTVSVRGGLGSYDIRPRRLFELGYVADLCRSKVDGRNVCTFYFLPPWTQERFLADPLAQVRALELSMQGYQQDLRAGRLLQPDGVSLSGALAILHVGGRGALADHSNLFDHTRTVYERAQGAF